jgi:membrane associated rhomboid family serine protease
MRAMSDQRLTRPVYEALPWVYLACGLAALTASYLTNNSALVSTVLGLPGLIATLGGVVVLLRRRGYRKMRADYFEGDSSVLSRK